MIPTLHRHLLFFLIILNSIDINVLIYVSCGSVTVFISTEAEGKIRDWVWVCYLGSDSGRRSEGAGGVQQVEYSMEENQ